MLARSQLSEFNGFFFLGPPGDEAFFRHCGMCISTYPISVYAPGSSYSARPTAVSIMQQWPSRWKAPIMWCPAGTDRMFFPRVIWRLFPYVGLFRTVIPLGQMHFKWFKYILACQYAMIPPTFCAGREHDDSNHLFVDQLLLRVLVCRSL